VHLHTIRYSMTAANPPTCTKLSSSAGLRFSRSACPGWIYIKTFLNIFSN
jgi:hypothetical protein